MSFLWSYLRGLGIFLIVLASKSLDGQAQTIVIEGEKLEAGKEHICSLSSTLVTTDCRDSEYCAKYSNSGGGGVSCSKWAPIKLCYCESTLMISESKSERRARFAILNDDMQGDPNTWCQEHLNGEAWPNFLAFNKDASEHEYCGFRAYGEGSKLEGTSMEEKATTCSVDMVLDPDYKCVTAINKGGFPCVETSDGLVYAGTTSDLVKQRQDCSKLSTSQKVVLLVLGVILILFSIVWEAFWLKELVGKLIKLALG
mmetsp:Transcript_16008/g.34644  ORF Transcript_16008/g.34644 Transcript_16008/m.34644 type:complete len:256 (+) Transcript_16008:91-858(+)|eukprot:CAMPEP_0206437970 /NCGR_PEP_ID=MMETSP0324_2-20121206/11342_1 /ASSEMBLY_ACC=CAM_ASM_000836 /TAXON_ID=2866 /ORGANISM="Crypthecodinium cohnii, Strain Seligo" /LENGTH=255 /DNA_ID=CAMNT_0053905321 /DNA_START=23 /DNA_END=790 /DNA_ORIENTATION=-